MVSGIITTSKRRQTRQYEVWLVGTDKEIYRVTVARSRARDTLTTARYVISRALKVNGKDYYSLGNRRVNGEWITEWVKK